MSAREVLTENISENIERHLPAAIDAALPTASKWGAPRPVGLCWATYKATCRRNGVFTGLTGFHDFNQDLFDPISKNLANGWERAFQRRLPWVLDNFVRAIRTYLDKFHLEATAQARERGTHYTGVSMLTQQLQAHLRRLNDVRTSLLALIQEMQRDANREFTPLIQQEMTPAYQGCANERGMLMTPSPSSS